MADTKVPHRRGEHVRQAVLAAAYDEIVDRGAADATIAGVAARSGVHETTIYRRWPTREQLFVDALLGRSASAIPVPDTGSTRLDLLEFVTDVAEHLASPEGRATLQMCATMGGAESAEHYRQAFWGRRAELVRPVLQRGVERGDLRADVDPRLVLEAMVAPLHARILLTGEPVDADLARRLVDLVLTGAGPRPRGTTPLAEPGESTPEQS